MTTETAPDAEPGTLAPNVVQAIARVRADLAGVGKNQHMNQPGAGQYAYRGIEDITAAIGPLMGKHCVVPVPHVTERTVEAMTINGKPWTQDTMQVTYDLVGPGGADDKVTVGPFYGLARDNSDKGTNKAMTQVFKQMLVQVFCIGDNRDDVDGAVHERDDDPRRQTGPTLDDLARDAGWETAADIDHARHDARNLLARLTEAGAVEREVAAGRFRDYQRPDGPDEQPRGRTRAEHDEWMGLTAAAFPVATADPDNEPDHAGPSDTAQSAQEPAEPPAATDGPEGGQPPAGVHEGNLDQAMAVGGIEAVVDMLGRMPAGDVRNELRARHLDDQGPAAALKRRLGQHLLVAAAAAGEAAPHGDGPAGETGPAGS